MQLPQKAYLPRQGSNLIWSKRHLRLVPADGLRSGCRRLEMETGSVFYCEVSNRPNDPYSQVSALYLLSWVMAPVLYLVHYVPNIFHAVTAPTPYIVHFMSNRKLILNNASLRSVWSVNRPPPAVSHSPAPQFYTPPSSLAVPVPALPYRDKHIIVKTTKRLHVRLISNLLHNVCVAAITFTWIPSDRYSIRAWITAAHSVEIFHLYLFLLKKNSCN